MSLYRTMLIIRQTEEELARCHQRGLIHGACHTYVGQEAIATGVCAHLTKTDTVFSTHRGHGHALAKGMPPRELMAELFGRATGCSRGRGGSMHLFSPEIGMMGTSGIVGPCMLQACGGGYSAKLMKNGNVAVAFFGDGAVNNGAFHEALNMASIWKLPTLFICENNQYATEVPFSYSSGSNSVAGRAAGYGLPGFEVDGNDVLEVAKIAGDAVARARSGQGATLIECKTYRTRAHAEGMGDFTYRTREEVDAWKERCPIVRSKTAAPPELAQQAGSDRSRSSGDRTGSSGVCREQSISRSRIRDDACVFSQTCRINDENPPQFVRHATGQPREISFTQATVEALAGEMARNPTIFVMGEGIGIRGGNFRTTPGLYDLHGPNDCATHRSVNADSLVWLVERQ